ncbi:hypothetical protein PN96_21745 [Vibrio natriegens NBRC 15636 = ATCC 14048 = DSM 759]|nr:hypothetical protein PN96_21745 [Vibrio natriegens NBRC 15636 = ATCC 14048 = DSM 759]
MLLQSIAVCSYAKTILPPSQDDWVSSKQYVQVNDQVKMAYVEWGNPDAEPVVLVHGYSDNSRAYSTIAPYLNDKHYFAVDLRGHGNTSAPTCCYYIGNYAEDVSDFINVMKLKSPALVGHSLGSITAGTLASIHPKQISKLVLISSAVKMNPDVSKWLYDTVTTLNYPLDPKGDFIQKEWAPNPGDMDEKMLSKLRQEEAAMPQNAWVGTIKGLEIMDWSLAARHISVPTLIMWGDQDELMQEKQNNDLQKAIPDAKMIVYKGLGHSMYWQQPERCAKDLMSFING